ncbi:unnamed protein product [Rotaria sordida]|uniref:Uncharacterized protein n=1 Tax=Rotaria sordida TaxID=392033 RepID=A0A818RT07_9BILA|nr:unnamed protein product [Rotaria sordida]
MTSDVEDLTRFYANLPSIFEIDPSTTIQSSSDTINTIVNNEKIYQPIFGSFLFANSEPFTRAAFINSISSSSSSIDIKTIQKPKMNDNDSIIKENHISNSTNIQSTSHPSLVSIEDFSDMDNEDDFDGISIQHNSTLIKKKLNNDNNLLDRFSHNHNENDDDNSDSFLNDFTDEEQQQHDSISIPFLFKDIPDIDDPNEQEQEDDDRILFDDHMDMFDQSDSICSSSPDSLLSSSHLRDDDDEEINNNNDDDDVTLWNDDFILGKTTLQNDRPNAPLPPPIALNLDLQDQVDFIDSSPSNSICSNDSLHLSIGYTDQAQIFINDGDDFITSSDSDNDDGNDDDDDDDKIHVENNIFNYDDNEELSLQINLDYHRSRSSSSIPQSLSTYSSSPIVTIDEDINEIKPIQSGSIAKVDDDDDDDDDYDDLEIFNFDQSVLSRISLENLLQLKNETRQNEIVHDIIRMRRVFNEHDNDDEFIAIMHNPSIFEQVLYDSDNQQQLDLAKQINIVTSMVHTSPQPFIDNKIESKSIEHYQNIQQPSPSSASSLSISNSKKNSRSNIKTTNNSSTTTVNHFLIDKEKEENVDAITSSSLIEKKEEKLSEKTCSNINRTDIMNNKHEQQNHYQMMSSDDEFDNDLDLLNTLAQLHGLVYIPRLSSEINQKTNEQIQQYNEEKTSSKCFSLTSLTSSGLFNNNESHSTDIIFDFNVASSLKASTNELNNSITSLNHFIINDLQKTNTISNINNNNNHLQQTTIRDNINSNFNDLYNQSMSYESLLNDNTNLIDYLHWLINHLNDDLKSPTKFHSIENLIQNNHTITNTIHHNNKFQQSNIIQEENRMLSSINTDITQIIEKLTSNILQLKLDEINESKQRIAYFVDQLLSQAIYEVNNEDHNLMVDNLESVMNWHNQTDEQLLDPFDQTFDNMWMKQFEVSDDIINQNNIDRISFYSNTFDESNLFSTISNQENPIQESLSSSLLINSFDSSITTNNLTKYSLIESIRNINSDDSSIFQNDFIFNKSKSSITTDEKIKEEITESKNLPSTENEHITNAPTTKEINGSDSISSDSNNDDNDDDDDQSKKLANIFATTSRLSQFEAYASDQPLNTLDEVDGEYEEALSDPLEQKSNITKSTGGDDEPWELEDSGEEKVKPIPAIISQKYDSYDNVPLDSPVLRVASKLPPKKEEFKHKEESTDDSEQENYDNYFDKHKPTEDTSETPISKTVRFDENIEKVAVLTPQDSLDGSAASTTSSDTDDIEDEEDTTLNFQTVNDRITDYMSEKETNKKETNEDKTDEVTTRNTTHPPETRITSTESEDLPPPLPPLPPLTKKSSTSSDNIPLKSTTSSSPKSNRDLKRAINLRSESEMTPTMQTTTDAKLLSDTDTPIVRSFESEFDIFVFYDNYQLKFLIQIFSFELNNLLNY